MSQIKCFVINLPQSTERCRSCCLHLKRLGLEYEIFQASDGHNLTEKELQVCDFSGNSKLNLAAKRSIRMDNALSLPEAGCALSHLRVYQHILQQQLPCACVIEDDCLVKPPFKQALQAIATIPDDWELVHFANTSTIRSLNWAPKVHFGDSPKQYFQKIGLPHPWLNAIYNQRRLIYGTFLYVISATGCRKLLKLGYPVRFPSDILTGHIAFNRLNIWQVFPQASFYANFDSFNTLIPDRPKHDLHTS